MKKVSLALLLFVLSYTAFAQKIIIGGKAGINLTSLSGLEDYTDPNTATKAVFSNDGMKAGFCIGGFARFSVAGIYIQPELLYAQRRTANTSTGTVATIPSATAASNTIQTIDIPIMIGKSFIGGLIRVNAGPLMSFAAGSNLDATASLFQQSQTKSGAIQQLNSAQWGIQAGVGVDVSKFTIDLRYETYFNKLSSDPYNSGRMGGFQLTVGYKIFSLGGL